MKGKERERKTRVVRRGGRQGGGGEYKMVGGG